MVTVRQCEKLLGTYSLEEILEQNDLTEAECLEFLLEQEFITMPEPVPVDV